MQTYTNSGQHGSTASESAMDTVQSQFPVSSIYVAVLVLLLAALSLRVIHLRRSRSVSLGDGGGVDGEDIIVHRVPLNGIEDFVAAKRAEGCGIDVRVAMLLVGGLLA